MRFSIFLWTKDSAQVFLRECLTSILEQTHDDFEVIVLDENADERAARLCSELFPRDQRMIYHRLKNRRGIGYSFNAGLHKCTGDYILFLGQHDRISESALEVIEKEITENLSLPDYVYFDNDELIGADRMNPQFKPQINVELLRHTNYIGDFYAVRKETFRKIGLFNQNLKSAPMYEFLLRGIEKKCTFLHIPRLIYHQRLYSADLSMNPEIRKIQRMIYREHMTVCAAHLAKMGVDATLKPHKDMRYWNVMYFGEYKRHRSDFFVIREDGVKVRHREKVLSRMYGILRQNDVGLVGARFDRSPFLIDNVGYIFDTDGIAYPACHGHSARAESYLDHAFLTADVSMVDPAFFIIDTEVFKRVGGLNRRLTGRAQMLDLCLKIKRAKRRVVCDVMSVAKKRNRGAVSSQDSNALLIDKWGEVLKKGDPYYNRNLPIGLENYILY